MKTSMQETRPCLSRRELLIFGGSALTVVGLVSPRLPAFGQSAQLVLSHYAPKQLLSLSDLRPKTPIEFTYPTDASANFLVMLGEKAGGGIGPDEDIVAFNTLCPHMGGPVGADLYKAAYNVVGPCPLHLSTFDLTKHGMIVSGHATDSLPQIALELRGRDIYATGVMGLIYGYSINPVGA